MALEARTLLFHGGSGVGTNRWVTNTSLLPFDKYSLSLYRQDLPRHLLCLLNTPNADLNMGLSYFL